MVLGRRAAGMYNWYQVRYGVDYVVAGSSDAELLARWTGIYLH